jgi:hypothetical protein
MVESASQELAAHAGLQIALQVCWVCWAQNIHAAGGRSQKLELTIGAANNSMCTTCIYNLTEHCPDPGLLGPDDCLIEAEA